MSVTTPGCTVPGHQKIAGVRTPPSHVVPLPSRSGPAEPPCVANGSHGPLSLVKTTSVCRSTPAARSASSTRPMLQSISSMTSP